MKVEAPKGMSVYNAIGWAKVQASLNSIGEIQLEFNDITLTVNRSSFDIDIAEIYALKCEVQRLAKRIM